jgi:hypothetical protein
MMRTFPKTALVLVLASSVSACAIPHRTHWAKVTPVTPPRPSAASQVDTDYQSASAAIWRRDYGRALDLLQSARANRPDDVRVLNAFGVVYDKLGRFDLSARYYAQARTLDPASPIVAQNMAYSALMQGKTPVLAPAMPALATTAHPSDVEHLATGPAQPALIQTASAAPPRASGGRVVQIAPGIVRLELASVEAPANPLPALTGHPLTIVNATGRADSGEGMRLQLASKGWSTPKGSVETKPRTAQSAIQFSAADLRAAEALARTLPGPVRLVACSDGCAGVRLILGVDSTTWSAGHASAARRHS